MESGTKIGLALGCAAVLALPVFGWRIVRTTGTIGPIVTAAEFARIEIGMTYAECVGIIGEPGTPYGATGPSTQPDDRTEWVSFIWNNSRDSSAEISFFHGEVESKRARSLP